MHNEHEHHDHGHDAGKFEPTDARVAPVLALGVALVLVTVASFLAGYILLKYSTERTPMSAFEPSPLVSERQEWNAGNVRLQVNLAADLQKYLSAARPRLTSYGVISEDPQIYHFPIDKAIDYVADNGFPEFKPFGDGSLDGTAPVEE